MLLWYRRPAPLCWTPVHHLGSQLGHLEVHPLSLKVAWIRNISSDSEKLFEILPREVKRMRLWLLNIEQGCSTKYHESRITKTIKIPHEVCKWRELWRDTWPFSSDRYVCWCSRYLLLVNTSLHLGREKYTCSAGAFENSSGDAHFVTTMIANRISLSALVELLDMQVQDSAWESTPNPRPDLRRDRYAVHFLAHPPSPV